MKEKDKLEQDLKKYDHYNQQPLSSKTNQQDNPTFDTEPKRPGPPPRGTKKKHIIIFSILFIAVIVTGIAAIVLTKANNIVNRVDFDHESNTNIYVDPDSLQSLPNVYNILLLGIDMLNEGESYPRSDTMMLVSLDKVNKKIKLTSFMRDIYLYIPGYENEKMNAACQLGGPQLVMDTIEYHFGVNVDSYVMVDFESFASIIDQLGGVDIEVTEYEASYIQKNISPDVKAGMNTLNGDAALVYSRIRYLDSDFQRTGRQRKMVEALIKKAKNASVFKLLDLANELAPQVKTNLTKSDMSFLARNSVYYLSYDVEELRIPTDAGYTDIDDPRVGQALKVNLSDAKTLLQNFIYPTINDASSAASTTESVTEKSN